MKPNDHTRSAVFCPCQGGHYRSLRPKLMQYMHVAFARFEGEADRAYDAKISPSRWIELSTCCCGSPGHWQRMMK
jgi:hypothetical protein